LERELPQTTVNQKLSISCPDSHIGSLIDVK